MPLAAQIHFDLPLLPGHRRHALAERHLLFERFQETLRRHAVQVLDDAVIREDLHLVVGKRDGKDAIVLTSAFRREALSRARRRRGAVMAIGDVERVDLRERVDDCLVLAGRHLPDLVMHAVRRGDIEQRLVVRDAANGGVNLLRGAIGQKHRPGLRADREHVPRPIVFLVGPGLLVLFDPIAIVLVDRKARRDARLHVVPHRQAIHVKARDLFDHERRVGLEGREGAGRLPIGRIGMGVGAGGHVDLRPRYVEEAQRIARSQRPSFIAADDVVGDRRDRRGGFRRRTQGGEGKDGRHELLIIGGQVARSSGGQVVRQGSCTTSSRWRHA